MTQPESPGDGVFDEEEVYQHRRKHADQGAGHQPAPLEDVVADQLIRLADGNCLVAGRGHKDKRIEIFVFAANDLPPAKAFWSLTLYSPDHYLMPNPIDRYTLRDANFRHNIEPR